MTSRELIWRALILTGISIAAFSACGPARSDDWRARLAECRGRIADIGGAVDEVQSSVEELEASIEGIRDAIDGFDRTKWADSLADVDEAAAQAEADLEDVLSALDDLASKVQSSSNGASATTAAFAGGSKFRPMARLVHRR